MRSLFLLFLVSFQITSHAALTPDAELGSTIKSLLTDVGIANPTQRVNALCTLVKANVDLPAISSTLLGSTFSTLNRDSAGIAQFNALMPSIIVTAFYSLVSDKAGASFTVNPTPVPKGSARVGYQVNINGLVITVDVSKRSGKIVDAEGFNISLVSNKRDTFQRVLQQSWDQDNARSLPVTDLVKSLIASGDLIRCP
jgi:hypothetical protein